MKQWVKGMRMRARIKAELVVEGKVYDERSKREELIVELFCRAGFNIVTKKQALDAYDFVRCNYAKLSKDFNGMEQHVPTLVSCLLGRSCRSGSCSTESNQNKFSVDDLLNLRSTIRTSHGAIDEFTASWFDWIIAQFVDNHRLVFCDGEKEFACAAKEIREKFRHFLAYLDAIAVTIDLPEEIREKEMAAWVCTGYEDNGQVSFMVTHHNDTSVYIRLKANLFRKMKSACLTFLAKFSRKSRWWWTKKLYSYFGRVESGENGSYIKICDDVPIEVMEPKKDQPTIRGYVVQINPRYLWNEYAQDILLIAVLFVLVVVSWVDCGSFADPSSSLVFDPSGSECGRVERINTGLFVSFCVALVNFISKVMLDKRSEPVRWVSETKK